MDIKDRKNTEYWAIATVAQVSAVASGIHFMLANRATGRAHSLYFVGAGLTFGVDGSLRGKSKLDYTEFRTRKPCNFADFDGVGARITGIKAGLGVGYDKMYVTIWAGTAHRAPVLSRIVKGGWGVKKPGVSGQAATYGVLAVKYGNGDPMGEFRRVIDVEPVAGPDKLLVRVEHKPHETPLLAMPGDVLFDFDSATLKKAARPFLERAEQMINLRDRGEVVIEGHTDSVGDRAYNERLSLRRGQAVKDWLVHRGVKDAHGFLVVGRGEDKPVQPNTLANGEDNPAGRKLNRRVEIHLRN